MLNTKETVNGIVKFIRDYYKNNNLKGAVIGISGGKDSAVVAGLFVKALGSENVTGIWMPCHSKEEDKQNAIKLANHFGFELKEFDLTSLYDYYVNQFSKINNPLDSELKDANINIKPRLRTATLYYYAAYLSKKNKGVYIVPGTSNKCEIYVGYFTKGGDDVADIKVLADLTVEEVIKVGEEIGVPYEIVHKVPDDGLSGLSDEDKLGVKYSEIADVIENDGINTPEEVKTKIYMLHQNNSHKFNIPIYKK
mgnify:CR=1 FL=1